MSNSVVITVPCLLTGGTEVHTLMLARALIAGGYRVTICAYYEYDPVMVEACEEGGARVRLLDLQRDGTGKNLTRLPKLARELSRVLRDERPAFVHVQYMTPSLVPLLAARFGGARRVLATVHVPGHHYGKRLWRHRLVAARLCDAFLCNSECVERSFFGDSLTFDEPSAISGRKHFAIPNCVDLEEVDAGLGTNTADELRRSLGIAGHSVVGMVSRLSHEKGPDVLLDAWSDVIRRHPNTKLIFVGDGRQRAALAEHAGRLGTANAVIWTGRLSRPETLRHLALMDVVVAPSRWEGFGLSAAEAMACGKPVVASDVDGLREVVDADRTGLLVPAGDSRRLADAIGRLLDDRELRSRLGNAGRTRVEKHLSFETFAERHLRLYDALAGEKVDRRVPVPQV